VRLITLDFETYFANDYTLSKMTTEEYVRDPRFKAHLVGVKVDELPARWFGDETCPECGGIGEVPIPGDTVTCRMCGDYGMHADLARLKLNECAALCHHAHFDGLILAHHFGIRPAFWFDTLSMARLIFGTEVGGSLAKLAKHFGLPEKNVPYDLFKGLRDLPPNIMNELGAGCAHDVELTHAIFKKLLPLVPRSELRSIDQTIRMFTEPKLVLDSAAAQAELDSQRERKERLLADIGATRAEVASSASFRALLEAQGYPCPMKPSPTNPDKEIPALSKTDQGMKDLLESDNETVAALAAARLGVKSTIGETRAARLLSMASRGALLVYLKFAGAHTVRFSGADKVNWQNLTPALKKCILAPKGYRVVTVDASQVECRGVNWLAGQWDVLDRFARGVDIYSENASAFYGRPITKADKKERHLGKTIELGCGYGMSSGKFQAVCRQGALGGPPIVLSDDEAKAAVGLYRTGHPQVVRLWKEADHILEVLALGGSCDWGPMRVHRHAIWLPNGTPLWYRNLRREQGERGAQWVIDRGRGPQRVYGALLVENVTQALFSGLLIREAMLRIGARYPIALQVHDDITYLAPEAEADEALAFGIAEMCRVPAWCPSIPLAAEGGHSERYDK
jgi:DNA polymerase